MSSRSSSLIEGLPRQSLTDRAAPMRLATASARRPCRTEKAEPAPAARASFLTGRLDEHRPYRLLGGGAAQHLGGRRRDNFDLVLGEPRARRRRRFSGRYRQPFADEIRSSSLRLGPPLVSSDELIGNVVQVIAYYLRLRADTKNIVADTPDQRSPQPAATAPRVSHVWQATIQSWEGSTPSPPAFQHRHRARALPRLQARGRFHPQRPGRAQGLDQPAPWRRSDRLCRRRCRWCGKCSPTSWPSAASPRAWIRPMRRSSPICRRWRSRRNASLL